MALLNDSTKNPILFMLLNDSTKNTILFIYRSAQILFIYGSATYKWDCRFILSIITHAWRFACRVLYAVYSCSL